jgi:hypothetical protein
MDIRQYQAYLFRDRISSARLCEDNSEMWLSCRCFSNVVYEKKITIHSEVDSEGTFADGHVFCH